MVRRRGLSLADEELHGMLCDTWDMLSEIELNKFGDGRVFVLCVALVSPVLSSSSCRRGPSGEGAQRA